LSSEAPPAHPDLPAEQAYLHHAYECLAEMLQQVSKALQAEAYSDAWAQERLQQVLLARQADLDKDQSLCFGRIDRTDGDTFYIGRRHVHDAALDPVVIDWRAPVAEAFYQAGIDDPWDLERRRNFLVEGRRLLDISDDVFAELRAAPRRAENAGPLIRAGDSLLAELTRERSGTMRDVAATIQAEQDRLIRLPADGILVIQGAPGTGKTAVGLHRAAFLLYQLRDTLRRTGVLIVGPNAAFMRYIERVLPSLGETTVVQKSIDDLGSVRIKAEDRDAAQRVKGDPRMAAVLRRALRQRTRPPAPPTTLQIGLRTVPLRPESAERLLEEVHGLPLPYREARDEFELRLGNHLASTVFPDAATSYVERQEALQALYRDRGFQRLVDRIWPVPSAADVVRDLLGSRVRLDRAAEGILEPAERRLLERQPAAKASDERWTRGDVPLLDEAQVLLAGVPRTYGHVVVDEAQDLSPMQLRMIARRAPTGSMTLLGDIGQATGVWAHASWEAVLEHLPNGAAGRIETLNIGYRVPRPILELASLLLPMVAPDLEPPVAIREGEEPVFVTSTPGALLRVAVAEMERSKVLHGTVGVIAPERLTDALQNAAIGNRVEFDAGGWGRGRKITVLSAREAKGLEFDHVILLEPAAFTDAGREGYRQLYVGMTRATKTLRIVHSRELPRELRPLVR
jgi:DNA helicase IV